MALRVHDASKNELSDANLKLLVNQAIDDLNGAGIVLPLAEDESISLSASVYDYSVPAGFAYIRELREESTTTSSLYPTAIDPYKWRITIETGSTPVIKFDSNQYTPVADINIKVIGQKRVAQLSDDSDVVPIGLVAFIRERTVSYAALHLTGTGSQLLQVRQRIGEAAWEQSEVLLSRIPGAYRPVTDAVRVPER